LVESPDGNPDVEDVDADLEANVQVEPSSSEDEGPVITQGPAMGPPQTPESLYCAICHGTPVAGTRTKYDVLLCLHKFHTVCLSKWLKKIASAPYARSAAMA
jgi:hypothetical protein